MGKKVPDAKSRTRKALYKCRDCDDDFIAARKVKKYIFCPLCGENVYTEKIMDVTYIRPFLYRRPWTAEEIEIIESGVDIGLSDKKIAEELEGRTHYAIRSKRMRLKQEKQKQKQGAQ